MSTSQLGFATKLNLRAEGHPAAAKLVNEVVRSPRRAIYYQNAFRKERHRTRKMSGEEALSVMVEAKLTRHQYNIIRAKDPERFPSYKVVQNAKKMCYPKKEEMHVTDSSAEVTLQALMDHTVDRLVLAQKEVILTLNEEQLRNLCLICKWGFDGSSGHSSYKQNFVGMEADDSSVFITSVVPIQLVCECSSKKIVVWQNPRSSSTRYCRPIKFEYKKESTQVSEAEKHRVDTLIQALCRSIINIEEKVVEVSHKLIFTMVDGKVCNALTNTTSSQRCYICGASSKDFNEIEKLLLRPYNPSALQFGLSVLHCWIRSFECLLHIAYRLPIQKWKICKEDKDIVAANKVQIQKKFRNQMGLIVDQPKPGFGNSNDGNTARRFFSNEGVASEILGVDKLLIEKMHSILVAISSGYDIHIENFRAFTLDTAKYFVDLYPWYYMPPTVHKLLIHGPDVVHSALLPIGQLTEEAQEARNKDFKTYREHFSRKCSRKKCNEDVLNLLLITSDPLITSLRQMPKKTVRTLPKEVFDLIIAPNVFNDENSNILISDDEIESDENDF
ncbi:uncharacterized protein LOC129939232 [Eupeodes corollae]|uniref:uncharacterized protein LOC129939232 n=1 Tax=Eupeodes corollae TaxID=290404 RepID=UPI0024914F89|nr:uncharacterized protein LOC129939232 [Eupeodes corollae]